MFFELLDRQATAFGELCYFQEFLIGVNKSMESDPIDFFPALYRAKSFTVF